MDRSRVVQVGLAMLFLMPHGAVSGQVTTVVDVLACSSCGLSFELAASLGDLEDGFSPAERPQSVVHDARGRFLLIAGFPAAHILVYGPGGDLEEIWGGEGEGPGEYGAIRQLRLFAPDTIAVWDTSHRRLTRLSSSGEVLGTQRIDLGVRKFTRAAGNVVVVAGEVQTPGGAVLPLHIVGADGTYESLGEPVPANRERPSSTQRHLAAAGDGVWAVRPDEYRLERWNLDGTIEAILERDADWFPDREIEGAVSFREVPPVPFLVDLHVDPQGQIWTMSRVAAANWSPSASVGAMASWGRYFDTIVEVIDPNTGELRGAGRLPGYGHSFTNDGLVITHREGPFDLLVVDVWRVSIDPEE